MQTDQIAVIDNIAETPSEIIDKPMPMRKLYFINEDVEWYLTQYLWTACTKAHLRDKIMSNATELIRQIIRKQGLHTIYPGQEESAFGDLLQTAWLQIERTLYKYRARPHCRPCFNNDRPSDSLLYSPAEREYGIKTVDEVLSMHKGKKCPYCSKSLTSTVTVEPRQGLYGGTETILYRGMSKVFNMWCVKPNTHIFGCCGLNTIGSTIEGFKNNTDIHIHGLDGIKPIQAAKIKSLTDTLIVTTRHGYNLECSPEHKILVLRDDGPEMVETKDIKLDDLIAIQSNQRIFGDLDDLEENDLDSNKWKKPASIDVEIAYILGLIISNGSYKRDVVTITNLNAESIKLLFNNSFGLDFEYETKTSLVVSNISFVKFLHFLGFPIKFDRSLSSIPKRLLELSYKCTLSLLSGIFDGRGTSIKTDGTVEFSTFSVTLRDQVRMLLLNLGMITVIRDDFKLNHNYSNLESIVFTTKSSYKFYELIGLSDDDKNYNKNFLSDLTSFDDMVYGINEKFRRLIKNHPSKILSNGKMRRIISGDSCTYETLDLLSNWSDYSDDCDYKFITDRIGELTKKTDSIHWLPVTSIVNSQSELCEISVNSDTHTYIANGIVSHNSQIARTVILAFIKKEGRDRKNSSSYVNHLETKNRPVSGVVTRFLSELREMWKYHDDYIKIINGVEFIFNNDERPHDGIISKIAAHTCLQRSIIVTFIQLTKLRSVELSDSNINRGSDEIKVNRRKGVFDTDDE